MSERPSRRECAARAFSDPSGEATRASMPPPPAEFGRVVMSWSGGKDSAMALHRLQNDSRYEVVGLLTTISREFRRVSHHGVREELLERQAEAIGLPLRKLYFPGPSAGSESGIMEDFERCLTAVLAEARAAGVFLVGHGDIFLRDLRAYRERRLAAVGMRGVFPLWGEDTTELLHRFTRDRFRAVITCVEPIAAKLAGAELSSSLLEADWPAGVDPCGEHGEYHSFVYDGPIFSRPVPFLRGRTVVRDGRHYTDLLHVPSSPEMTDAT